MVTNCVVVPYDGKLCYGRWASDSAEARSQTASTMAEEETMANTDVQLHTGLDMENPAVTRGERMGRQGSLRRRPRL